MKTNEVIARWALEFSTMIETMVEESGLILASSTDVVNAALRMVVYSKQDVQSKEDMAKAVQKATKKVINYWKTQEKML
ncbi:MAG TPA: hypothetical protein H9778_01710 [Candidatus Parabacteroides intestinavium]|nr:hypothetical protein [Candidatus Parabacteroides intestinavium]